MTAVPQPLPRRTPEAHGAAPVGFRLSPACATATVGPPATLSRPVLTCVRIVPPLRSKLIVPRRRHTPFRRAPPTGLDRLAPARRGGQALSNSDTQARRAPMM